MGKRKKRRWFVNSNAKGKKANGKRRKNAFRQLADIPEGLLRHGDRVLISADHQEQLFPNVGVRLTSEGEINI